MELDAFTSRMQKSFRADFSQVDIFCNDEARQFTQKANAIAVTQHNSIYLSPSYSLLHPTQREFILAHEFAHIAQKRLPRAAAGLQTASGASLALKEIDANAAAALAIGGAVARCRVPADRDEVSAWGPAGHYYASLFVMLAAGANIHRALRRAFFCQMPDQVYQFDAVAAALDYYYDVPVVSEVLEVLTERATPAEDIEMVVENRMEYDGFTHIMVPTVVESRQSIAKRRLIDRQISTGLHCLTSRKGIDEETIRARRLKDYMRDDVRFGLALHSYGDSFAHQNDDDYMFDPMKGHGFHGHTPDNCKKHHKAFVRYVANLFQIIEQTISVRCLMSFRDVLHALAPIATMDTEGDDDDVQRQHSQFIADMACKMGLIGKSELASYKPENEHMRYWKEFWPRHRNIMQPEGPEKVFAIVRKCGEEWAI